MLKNIFLLFVLLGIHLLLLLNTQFTAWPEMFSYPYLLNNGFILYKDFVHPYPPLLTILLAFLYSKFGYSLGILESFSWVVLLFSTSLVFLISLKISKSRINSFISTLFYVALQPFLEGNMMWFDIAIIPPILASIYLYINFKTDRSAKTLFILGLFLGISVFIKQTTGLFLISIFIILVLNKAKIIDLIIFLTAPVFLGIVLLSNLIYENSFFDFFNWTLIYPLTKWGSIPGYVQMSLGKTQIYILSLFSAIMIFLFFLQRKKLKNGHLPILFTFLLCSLIIVYPRFSFFHFQLALAIIVIIVSYLSQKLSVFKYVLLYSGILLLMIPTGYIKLSNAQARFYSEEEIKLAQNLNLISDSKQVFFLGIHSGEYVFSKTQPTKPWVDNYAWYFEMPNIQDEMITGWNNNPPNYIFWSMPKTGNWFDLGVYQPKKIVNYIHTNYTLKEVLHPNIQVWEKK